MKYGRIYIEGKNIPKGEPLFVLRGQDVWASEIVRIYARCCRGAGDIEAAEEIEAIADAMDDWPIKKIPD